MRDDDAYGRSVSSVSYPLHTQILPDSREGHGPSFARNRGLDTAAGEYVCFLDDDDEWVDDNYLAILKQIITDQRSDVPAIYSKQEAVSAEGEIRRAALWLNDIVCTDSYALLPASRLVRHPAFAHLNCSVYKRNFILAIGGFDESLRYEEDRELYIRALDSAAEFGLIDRFIARHYVPQNSHSSASTSISVLQKRRSQLCLLEKNLLAVNRKDLLQRLLKEKAVTLKQISETLDAGGETGKARHYALLGLFSHPSLKWTVYTIILIFKGIRSEK